MGYETINHAGGCYQNYWPDNDKNNLYIEAHHRGIDFELVIESIKSHFGEDAKLEEFTIEAEYIHTNCLWYDCYDSSDYTNFLHIERIKK